MDLEALLDHYLGTADAEVDADVAERIAIDFAVERDPGRRFALWALMHALGSAPDPDTAFKAESDRAAARDFTRLMARGLKAGHSAD